MYVCMYAVVVVAAAAVIIVIVLCYWKVCRRVVACGGSGVAVVASVDIDRSILIIPRGLLCLLCLLRVVHNTVLRCAAGKITIDPKAHLPY